MNRTYSILWCFSSPLIIDRTRETVGPLTGHKNFIFVACPRKPFRQINDFNDFI